MKYTPGPWKVDDSSIMAQFEGQEVQIATMAHSRWMYPDGGKTQRLHKQSKFNAELIASAPELQMENIELKAMVIVMSKALEHSIVALEYAAEQFQELGEDCDADMMERQAKENHGALSPSAGRELLEQAG